MKRLSQVLCIALSMTLLINLAGIEVLAAEVSSQNSEVAGSEKDTENTVDNDAGKEDGAEVKDETQGTVITDEEVYSGGEDGQNVDEKEQTDADSKGADENTILPDSEQLSDPSQEKALEAQETAEAAEGKVTVRPDETNTKLVVDWTDWKLGNAEKYEVAVKDSNDEKVEVAAVGKTTAEFAANAGEKYTVSVKAKGADGNEIKSVEIPAILLAAPANVTAAPGDTTVKLSWASVEGATGYRIAYGEKKETVTATSYTAAKLKNGTKYRFAVTAVCEYTGAEPTEEVYRYTSPETLVEAAPKSKIPAKVRGLTAIDGDNSAILTWSKESRADSYVIYRYNASRKTWDVVKRNVKSLTYTDVRLTSGKTYVYRVAAMNDGGVGALSDSVSVSVKKTPGTAVRTIGYKAVVKSKAPLFASMSSKKRVRYLKKGTRVTTIDYGRGRYQIRMSGGQTYWLSKDRLTFKASIWTTKDYSTKVKEDFVNKRGYSSPSKYLIWINAYTQRVIIFQGKKGNWKMIRNCRCATGTHLHPTPKGTFKITYKEKGWFYKKTYEKPIVHFKSQNSFHSRIKNYKGGYADATIGKPRSKGCVRLYDEDINFIYKYCPKGTTVLSH